MRYFTHQNRTGTSTEAQTSCRGSVVSRRLASTLIAKVQKLFENNAIPCRNYTLFK